MEDILSSIFSNSLIRFAGYLVVPVTAGFLLFAAWLNDESVSHLRNWRWVVSGFVVAIIIIMVVGCFSWPKSASNEKMLIQTPAARVAAAITYPAASPLYVTVTYTPTPTSTDTPTLTSTFTLTPTSTFTDTPTSTPTFTPTPTPTYTYTFTPIQTPTPRLPAKCFEKPVRITNPDIGSEFQINKPVAIYGAAYGESFEEIWVEFYVSETEPDFGVHASGWQFIKKLQRETKPGVFEPAKEWGGENIPDPYMADLNWSPSSTNQNNSGIKVWLRVLAKLKDGNARTTLDSDCWVWIRLKK